jgi:hypothetical protein
VNGSAGATVYINGTADNPVDSWADALTLSAALGLRRFCVAGGSAITLPGPSDNFYIVGRDFTLDLGGQSLTDAFIGGAHVSGTSAGTHAHFADCEINAVTLARCRLHRCAIASDIILSDAGDYFFDACFSGVAGTATPSVDFGAAVGDTRLNVRHYSGGIEIKNMGQNGSDLMSLEGHGQLIINANCAGGTVAIRGLFTVTDNAAGAVTLSDDARLTRSEVAFDVWEESAAGHVSAGSMGKLLADVDVGLILVRGLLHENGLLDSAVYDANENLTSLRLRTYDTEANKDAAAATAPSGGTTGLRETYTITATYDPVTGLRTLYHVGRAGS